MKTITRSLSLIMSLLIVADCCAIKFNGQDIATFMQSGQTACYTSQEAQALCVIIRKNGDIDVDACEVNSMQTVEELYVELQKDRHMFAKKQSGKTIHTASKCLTLNGFDGIAGEEIILQASQEITMESALLQAPGIFLLSDKIQATECFVDANVLQIEFSQQHSVVALIQFVFDKEAGVAHPAMQLDVDCRDQEKDDQIVVTGVRKVYIQFHPEAFK